MNKYRILCEVSGGVTGYNASYLKIGGKPITFDDKGHAEEVALSHQAKANGPYATASFKYSVEAL